MTDDASWLQSLVESRRPDPAPVVGRWALGIGDMVADHPLTPDKVRGLARKLNHFGGVAISEEGAPPRSARIRRSQRLRGNNTRI